MSEQSKRRRSEPATKSLLDHATRADDGGLECPKCGCRHFRVIYTNRLPDAIERRRECRNCNYRVFTREKIRGSEG